MPGQHPQHAHFHISRADPQWQCQQSQPASAPARLEEASPQLGVGGAGQAGDDERLEGAARHLHARLQLLHAEQALRVDGRRLRGQAGKVVRRKADAPFGLFQPQRPAHGPREPGIGGGMFRPAAFIQSTQDGQVVTLQACFKRSEDRKTRMAAKAFAHRHAHRQPPEQGIIGRWFDFRQVRRRQFQFGA